MGSLAPEFIVIKDEGCFPRCVFNSCCFQNTMCVNNALGVK